MSRKTFTFVDRADCEDFASDMVSHPKPTMRIDPKAGDRNTVVFNLEKVREALAPVLETRGVSLSEDKNRHPF